MLFSITSLLTGLERFFVFVCMKSVNQIYELFHEVERKKEASHCLIIMTKSAHNTHNAAEADQNIYHSLAQSHILVGSHY